MTKTLTLHITRNNRLVFKEEFGMVLEVILDEGGDVEVAVVVTLVPIQSDRHARLAASSHKLLRLKLPVLQKLIRLALQKMISMNIYTKIRNWESRWNNFYLADENANWWP